jgi:sulfur dioxygenase
MFFRQLFDLDTSTYTYIIGDLQWREAAVIDPVFDDVDKIINILKAEGLTLMTVMETHVHADHVTGAAALRQRTGAEVVISRHGGAPCADIMVDDEDFLILGNEVIRTIATPGHTSGCVSYRWRDRVFTGDALLIGGCGRTDFQNGSAGTLYDSITRKLFSLPDDTLVYPGHDYKGRRVSSIAEEKHHNARLAGKSRDEFIAIMTQLDLPMPRHIDVAVPANRRCGILSL